ncbi:MAG: hypothetical protein KDC44_23840, partial [Phaeodactylibacter sp.]|nr:hypothetical protein [Phaeodactylibacter sp.]
MASKTSSYKVVVLSPHNICGSVTSGVALHRFLGAWPKDAILQVCKYNTQDEVSAKYREIIPFYDFGERLRQSKVLPIRYLGVFLRRLFFFLPLFVGNRKAILRELKKHEPDLLFLQV